MAEEEERGEPRRSARLALTEITLNESSHETPNKNVSADEMVIIQRGPRRKPIIWSPVDQDRTPVRKLSKEKNSAETLPKRPSLNPKLRRRLILSPTKNSVELGSAIAKKLRSLPRFSPEFAQGTPEL
ncbi:hypothetical protein MTP99_012138 [Tenebrio molitor]|uniref:Uncharacterized protein n=1 Tax=Tenebrio molitor TaxID=7067 RepID=A0A8J6LE55_TENMO|nr:hypothetical protein GEV33_004926 [Tenebrio molitor]KAJ3630980.1 hypothetical protein MTP99_012138 [Tenebrio molitor]CAH1370578.1 unnamed protein product [Tenebrio molitor]